MLQVIYIHNAWHYPFSVLSRSELSVMGELLDIKILCRIDLLYKKVKYKFLLKWFLCWQKNKESLGKLPFLKNRRKNIDL